MRQIIRAEDMETMRSNHRRQRPVQGTTNEIDFKPVVKLVLPLTACVWLLSELEDEKTAFGLADLGLGCPELGSVWLPELAELDIQGLRVIQVLGWQADKTLSAYAKEAREHQRIIA